MIDLGPPPALHQPPPSGYEKTQSGLIVPKKDASLAMPAVFMPGLRGSGDFSLEPLASYNPNYQVNLVDTMIIPTQAMIGDLVFVIYSFAGYAASGGAGSWVDDGLGFTLTPIQGAALGSRPPFPSLAYRAGYRILTTGQVGATVRGYKQCYRAMWVFRPSKPITSVTLYEDSISVPLGRTDLVRPVSVNLGGKGSPVAVFSTVISGNGTATYEYGPGGDSFNWWGGAAEDGYRRGASRLYNTPSSDIATAELTGYTGCALSVWALKVSAD